MKQLTLAITIAVAGCATQAPAQFYSITNATGRTMISNGWFQYGTIGFTGVSDDLPMIVSSPTSGTPIACMWEASTIMDDYVNMKSLSVMLEGRHGYFGAPLSLHLRNQLTGQYELLGGTYWSTTDLPETMTITNNPGRFVSPGGIVQLMFKGKYGAQNVQCIDVIRFIHAFNTYGPRKRFQFSPSSVFMNQGTWIQGPFTNLATPDDQVVAADSALGTLDWQCDFTGVTYSGIFDSMDLTLRASCSGVQTINTWLYNWRLRRWEAMTGIPRTMEWGNFRLTFNPYQRPLDFISGGRVRARFVIGAQTRMYADLARLTVSVK